MGPPGELEDPLQTVCFRELIDLLSRTKPLVNIIISDIKFPMFPSLVFPFCVIMMPVLKSARVPVQIMVTIYLNRTATALQDH